MFGGDIYDEFTDWICGYGAFARFDPFVDHG
jgi:hypothetical protein